MERKDWGLCWMGSVLGVTVCEYWLLFVGYADRVVLYSL